jgi:hypothetical protein
MIFSLAIVGLDAGVRLAAMPKPRKKAAPPEPPEPPEPPRIGDKVTIPRSSSILEVDYVSKDGTEVTLVRPGTNLQWFRVPVDTLTYVERKPPARTSNPSPPRSL